jgi:hypothetical protein
VMGASSTWKQDAGAATLGAPSGDRESPGWSIHRLRVTLRYGFCEDPGFDAEAW